MILGILLGMLVGHLFGSNTAAWCVYAGYVSWRYGHHTSIWGWLGGALGIAFFSWLLLGCAEWATGW